MNNLIEENDYDEIYVIESSSINYIYDKPYFWEFYNAVKRIHIEQVRNNLGEYIFESIIEKKGINYKSVLFFKENSYLFPGMYNWAMKRLSLKLSETNSVKAYLPISNQNELLLERLLLHIVSSREQLKEPSTMQILNHYDLRWLVELDDEYEELIENN